LNYYPYVPLTKGGCGSLGRLGRGTGCSCKHMREDWESMACLSSGWRGSVLKQRRRLEVQCGMGGDRHSLLKSGLLSYSGKSVWAVGNKKILKSFVFWCRKAKHSCTYSASRHQTQNSSRLFRCPRPSTSLLVCLKKLPKTKGEQTPPNNAAICTPIPTPPTL
jgi:hypothetical protein